MSELDYPYPQVFDAALDGTREVALPIFVATITFCIVFYPVVFLSGLAKNLISFGMMP